MDAVVVSIGDGELAGVVHEKVCGVVEFAGAVTFSTYHSKKYTVLIKDLDAVIVEISYVYRAV